MMVPRLGIVIASRDLSSVWLQEAPWIKCACLAQLWPLPLRPSLLVKAARRAYDEHVGHVEAPAVALDDVLQQ